MGATERTAMIVATDGFFRVAVERILVDGLGFATVVLAGSLEEGAAILSRQPGIDLALFDMGLPDVSGVASLGQVRDGFPETKFVVLSDRGTKSDVLSALEFGIHGFVPKSIEPSRLADALRYVMDGNAYVPSFVTERPTRLEVVKAAPRRAPAAPDGHLTPRQREVLEQVVKGLSNKEIARALNLGEGTVKIHIGALFRAFGTHNRSALAVAGMRMMGEPYRAAA